MVRARILGEVMTWHSQGGDRTLTGAEAALIRETLAYVVDMVEEDITASADPWEFGVAALDRLEPPARLAMLAEVGWHLLRESESCPELTALNEATVAVLFNAIEQAIELEIDCQSDDDLETQTNGSSSSKHSRTGFSGTTILRAASIFSIHHPNKPT